jgi:hypothetical protein
MMRWLTLLVMVAAFTAIPVRAAGAAEAGTLAQARELYEAANYEQALTVLDALPGGEARTASDAQSVRKYRALCLLALDRTAEAERALEDMVRAEPAAPPPADLPPRVRSMMEAVRQRVVRALARDAYEHGRTLFEQGDVAAARAQLTTVVSLIDDRSTGLAADPAFADLRLLADGFLKLAAAQAAANAEAPRAAPSRGGAQPTLSAPSTSPTPAAPAPPASAPRPSTAVGSTTAGSSARGQPERTPAFVPPKPIAQRIPRLAQTTTGYATRREGELEIEVAVDGTVSDAVIRVPTVAAYDSLLIATAKHDWRYKPATRLGVPVPYRFRVRFVFEGQ